MANELTPKEDKNVYIPHSQYHGSWWPGNAWSQGINSHGIDLVCLEYSGLNTRSWWVNTGILTLSSICRGVQEMLHLEWKKNKKNSIFDEPSHLKALWSQEAVRFVFRIVQSLWNLTGTLVALLRCLSNFKAMQLFKQPILRLRDFTRSQDKTSYRTLNWGEQKHLNLTLVLVNLFQIT